jgi:putative aminopeptidase FrvX
MADTTAKIRWMKIAKGLLEQPTAPLREQFPKAYIRDFANARPQLSLSEDAAGNLLLKYPASGPNGAGARPLVLVAHLDHPCFWVEGVSGKKIELAFKGFVAEPHARPGSRLRLFNNDTGAATGTAKVLRAKYASKRLVSVSAQLTGGHTTPNGFAMWDFPGFKLERGKIVSRCCDDLLGAAAALSTLDEIARKKPKGIALWALFTRAEEVGFLGALEAIRLKVLPKNACVLSLECSKALPVAPQGGGAIVRVGDRASIFDPDLSQALRLAAEQIQKDDAEVKYQRKLMDGGSCEATAFCGHGYRSSGVAVPLGNYHNQAFDAKNKPCIGPESVRVDDYVSEIKLLVHLALRPELLKPATQIPAWMKERAKIARLALTEGGAANAAGLAGLRGNRKWRL